MERTKRPARPPQQVRSRRMVARLLDAAGELFLQRGYDKTTTNQIAEHAGVSIGSLYQFFPDKAAILGTLQVEWVAKLHGALDAALAGGTDDVPLETLVDRVLTVHVTLNREPPGLLGFLLTTPGTIDELHSPTASAINARVEEIIAARGIPMPASRRHVIAVMANHISRAIYSLGGPDGPNNTEVLRQTRHALVAYLRPLEPGHSNA
jgi:AcrR family transcriptional regulator